MKKQRNILTINVLVVVTCFLWISCKPKPDKEFLGTYSFCNDLGYYTEVSFLSSSELVICHEVQIEGRSYKYRIVNDSMFTYNKEDHLVSECRIINFSQDKIKIAVKERDSIYHFDYALISKNPLMRHAFGDTLTTEYKKYKVEYVKRSLNKRCNKIPEAIRVDINDIDTVFNDF